MHCLTFGRTLFVKQKLWQSIKRLPKTVLLDWYCSTWWFFVWSFHLSISLFKW